eukprot:CAMPEP_0202856250 /NCGR_PEP_ID=MMETSP1389-20130828/91935_1 /ASSEMBLY_ACC=CAM_ASM_000865 /TAXON_ID=302021 /ORGANISM="Rhodomonas sp., Strain CCMP768" /LENGTH=450 /DNA_ID=CAMNT_0049534895 /DNA_START=162 /DNA_END=1515 /DNA_ORIENTATION=-
METARKLEKNSSNGHLDKASNPSGKPDAADSEPSQAYSLMHAVLFLATGVCSTICNQMVFYHGASQPKTMLLSCPTYLGMVLVALLPVPRSQGPSATSSQAILGCASADVFANVSCMVAPIKGPSATSSQAILGCASADVFANVSCMVGLQFVGSGIFQVLYASVVCFTALLSKAFLGKSPSALQWSGIFAIAAGLCLTSHGSAPAHLQTDTGLVLMGIGITLVGCVGYASTYVMVESILSRGNSIEPQRLCVCVGAFGTLVHLAYMSSYTFPYFDQLIMQNIAAKGGDLKTVLMLYSTLVLSAFIHNWNYFFLLRHSGAVTTGVISALRAIGVFIVSGWLFCNDHASQCMTVQKSIAACVVAGGVLLYSFGKGRKGPGGASHGVHMRESSSVRKKRSVTEEMDEYDADGELGSAPRRPMVKDGRRRLESELKKNEDLDTSGVSEGSSEV